MTEPTKQQLEAKEAWNALIREMQIGDSHASNNVQTVVHQGLGAWGPAAIVACFASLLVTIGAVIILEAQNQALQRRLETQEAWTGVNNNVISKLQSTIEYMQKDKRP